MQAIKLSTGRRRRAAFWIAKTVFSAAIRECKGVPSIPCLAEQNVSRLHERAGPLVSGHARQAESTMLVAAL